MLKNLNDNEILYLDYGYVRHNHSRLGSEDRLSSVLFTKLYTDGEISDYEVRKPGTVGGYKIGLRNYNINCLETDEIRIKNHSFVITETYAMKWNNFGPVASFDPVLRRVQIYGNENKKIKALNFLSIVGDITFLDNAKLCRYDISHIEENPNVYVLKMKN
jgi:hypothetical protein